MRSNPQSSIITSARREVQRLIELAGDLESAQDLESIDGGGEASSDAMRARAPAIREARVTLLQLLREYYRRTVELPDDDSILNLRATISRLCVEANLQHLLTAAGIPHPVYNFSASFDENVAGPRGASSSAAIPTPARWRLMDIAVRLPIGVPASGLTLNAPWVRYYASQGFNILTYKTVRSIERPPHRHPQWIFVEDIEPPWQTLGDVAEGVRGDLRTWPRSFARFSTANSFGVPSPPPSEWQRDVADSLGVLSEGQLLIVSVMGTSDERDTSRHLIDDFVKVAQLAESAGAPAIELNLSCPNRIRPGADTRVDPPLSFDPVAVRQVVQSVREGLRNRSTKLVAKLSYLAGDTLYDVIDAVALFIDAVSGINTIQAPIATPDGRSTPFIGTAHDPEKERTFAGVSGSAIRTLGLDFVSRVAKYRDSTKANFDIIGIGGVASAADAARYWEAGADAVQSATGACVFPWLPQEIASTKSGFREARRLSKRAIQQAPRRSTAAGRIERQRDELLSALKDHDLLDRSQVTEQIERLSKLRDERRRELIGESLREEDVTNALVAAATPPALEELIRLRNDEGAWVYPAWQFDETSSTGTVNRLSDVLHALHLLGPIEKSWWLRTPNHELGATPLAALMQKRFRAVLAQARAVRAS